MSSSNAELAIRTATVARIREILPNARIIHELNVEHGRVRADIAAVDPAQLYLFEIKSARDTLGRLGQQVRHFHPVCHGLIVVADEKWCGAATMAGYPNCDAAAIIRFNGLATLWQWPGSGETWRLPTTPSIPWHHHMLRLLWTDELRAVAADHGLGAKANTAGHKLCREIVAAVPGAKIEAAVCAALRDRDFASADAPVAEERAAA